MIKTKTKRLFIAINLPSEIRKEVRNLIVDLGQDCSGVRWTNPETLHLTLHFLGDTTPEHEEKIKMAMQSLEGRFHQFSFEASHLGAFPNTRNPRVLFLNLKQTNGKSSIALQKLLGQQLSSQRIRVDRRGWKPHITLGRINELENFEFPANFKVKKLSFSVESFDLMQSKLHPDGAEHKIVEKFMLSKEL